jgi:hypothetical protein
VCNNPALAVASTTELNQMNTTRYFFDSPEGPIELSYAYSMRRNKLREMFPNVRALRIDSFSDWVGTGPNKEALPVTRMIQYKNRPSLHKCSAKCRNGKCGGVCECSCGGKNHGLAN